MNKYLKTSCLIIFLFFSSVSFAFSPEEIKEDATIGCTYNVLSFAEDVLQALDEKYKPDSIKKSIIISPNNSKDNAFRNKLLYLQKEFG